MQFKCFRRAPNNARINSYLITGRDAVSKVALPAFPKLRGVPLALSLLYLAAAERGCVSDNALNAIAHINIAMKKRVHRRIARRYRQHNKFSRQRLACEKLRISASGFFGRRIAPSCSLAVCAVVVSHLGGFCRDCNIAASAAREMAGTISPHGPARAQQPLRKSYEKAIVGVAIEGGIIDIDCDGEWLRPSFQW